MIKSILITGCSSGIGLESAKTLASRGYQVIASARNSEDVERLRSSGLTAIPLDITDSQSIEKAVELTLELCHGRIDALFNNAGFGIPGAVEDLNRSTLQAQFETNVFGPFELINKILPWMHKQGHGRIIQNSSVLGFVVLPFRGAYNSSKFALEGLTDTLRLELRGTNIYVSLIEPGPITSKFRQNARKAFSKHVSVTSSRFKNVYE